MHSAWIALGLEPDRFWQLTPREISRETRARIKCLDREQAERAWLAWHIAALPMAKKFPDLKTFMAVKDAPRKKSKSQSPEEQWANMKAIFLAFGGSPQELEKFHGR